MQGGQIAKKKRNSANCHSIILSSLLQANYVCGIHTHYACIFHLHLFILHSAGQRVLYEHTDRCPKTTLSKSET